MGDIINLRRVRKEAERAARAENAAANRLAHGQTKVQRELNRKRAERSARDLDAHKIDTGERT